MSATIRRLPALAISPVLAVGLLGLPTTDLATSPPEPVTPALETIGLEPVASHPTAAEGTDPEPMLEQQLETQEEHVPQPHGTNDDDPDRLEHEAHEGEAHNDDPLETVASIEPTDTDPFRVVAVTWKAGSADPARLTAWVRHRADGTWSGWHALPSAAGHAPQGAEAAVARAGTDPLVVPTSDGVQVRVEAPADARPRDLRVDLVDPGTSPADATAGSAPAAAAAAAASRPTILSRKQWGADENLRRSAPAYGQIKAAFVHHTVNSNTYDRADVPGIIRGIYAYHVRSLGWNDIGYNFLVDRFGRIWEGRYGGVDRPVIGAHTFGHNDDAFAMSAIGTHTTAPPSPAVLDAYGRLFAWKFGLHGVAPKSTVNLDGVRVNAISGHRDTYATVCPGDGLYSRLGRIRDLTASYLAKGAAPTVVRATVPTTLWAGRRLRVPVTVPSDHSGVTLALRARPTGGEQRWRTLAKGIVDDAGQAVLRTNRMVAGQFDVRVVLRTKPKLRSATTVLRIRPRPVTAELDRDATTRTSPVRLSVRTDPVQPGAKVRLKRRSEGDTRWRVVQRRTLGTDGSARFSVLPPTEGRHRFKASVPASTPSGSAPVTLTVAAEAASGGSDGSETEQTSTGGGVVPQTITRPADSTFTVTGRGYGHGRGMSQWGAHEAGRRGVSAERITDTYYPGTQRTTRRGNPRLKALMTRDTGSDLIVRPERDLGVRFTNRAGSVRRITLPTRVDGCTSDWWRAVARGGDIAIESLCRGSWTTWRTTKAVDGDSPVTFRPSDGTIDVAVRSGSGFDRRSYRGAMRAHRQGGTLTVVNVVRMQAYLRSVVPSEMPASWPDESLRAQAVAARTYALRERRDRSGIFDVYDNTRSQVYAGRYQYDTGWRVVRSFENTRTSRAVRTTKSVHLRYDGVPAFTQFSSSNGGVSAAGGRPYLRPARDRWDAGATDNPRRTWRVTVSAGSLERRYPALGRLRAIRITERAGLGKWGGRVMSMTLVGSRANRVVSGDTDIRAALGAYSSYLAVTR